MYVVLTISFILTEICCAEGSPLRQYPLSWASLGWRYWTIKITKSWVKYDNLRFKHFSQIFLILAGNETDDGDVMNYEWWRQWKLIGIMAASRCLIANAKYDMRCATTGNNGMNLKHWKADRINCHLPNNLLLGTELRIEIYNIAW